MSARRHWSSAARSGAEVKDIVDRRGWDVDIYGVSALLHLYPSRIVDELRVKLRDAAASV